MCDLRGATQNEEIHLADISVFRIDSNRRAVSYYAQFAIIFILE